LLTFGIFVFVEAEEKCVDGTSKVCTPFTYDGKNYTDCASGYVHYWCLIDGQTGSYSNGDYSKCGKCKAPEKPEDKPYVKKCVKGTNKVCTPFKYNDKQYNDCEFYDKLLGSDYHWCLVDDQTGSGSDHSRCGECVEETTTETTQKSLPTTKAAKANTKKTKSIKNSVASKTKRLSDKKCQKDTGNICVPFTYKGEVYNDCVPPTAGWVQSPWCLIANQTGSFPDYSTCEPCDEDKYVLHDTTNYKRPAGEDGDAPVISEGTSVIMILAAVAIAVVLLAVLSILGVIWYRRNKARNLLIKYNQANSEENDKL